MDFMICLPLSVKQKNDNYDAILVMIDYLTKIVYYKPIRTRIDITSLAGIIINMVIRYHGLSESIISDRNLLFILKFQSLLCYLLGIKWKLSTTYHLQTNHQTERQNSTIEAYLCIFVNWEQTDRTKYLPMAECAYNNVWNVRTGHTLFELNCGYHSRIYFEGNVNPCSKSRSADGLAKQLIDLILIIWQNLF